MERLFQELDKIHTPAAGVNPHDEWIDRQISQRLPAFAFPVRLLLPGLCWKSDFRRGSDPAAPPHLQNPEVSLLLLLLISLWQWQPVWNQTHFPIELLHGKRRHAEPRQPNLP
ncbi:MAG: hypothetical protein IPN74_17930 [Haliscomenobacter sp.]|nr:hypothetical protein [Haliscomenobacter sp.]